MHRYFLQVHDGISSHKVTVLDCADIQIVRREALQIAADYLEDRLDSLEDVRMTVTDMLGVLKLAIKVEMAEELAPE